MKKIIVVSILAFVFLLPTSDVFALSCPTSGVCTTKKSDLYLKNLGKFKYLDWTYKVEDSAAFLGKSGFYDFEGKWESIAYTVKGDSVVDYHVSIFDFKNQQEALELFTNLVLDKDYKIYKNSKGTVYQTTDANSENLLWLHNNIMVSINTNPDAKKKKDFLKKAFAVYSKKIPPQVLGELQKNYSITTTVPLPTPAKRDISIDLKVNGSDNSIVVEKNSTLDINWSSIGAEKCEASGSFMPKKGKSDIWGLGDNNLSINGNIKLIASGYSNKKKVYSPSLRIEVLCSNNIGYSTNSQARDSITIYVNE